jgi:hypothetical protein
MLLMEIFLAAIGALAGLAALAWAIWTWVLSGPRILVRASTALEPLRTVVVDIRNKGRAPITVNDVEIVDTSGPYSLILHESTLNPSPDNPSLPHRLEPHSQLILKYKPPHGDPGSSRTMGKALVYLGNGKEVEEPIWSEIGPPPPLLQWFERYRR